MANNNPDGLELDLHMLHDLMQNKAEVNSVWAEETNSTVCFGVLFWQTSKRSKPQGCLVNGVTWKASIPHSPNHRQRQVCSSKDYAAPFCPTTPSPELGLVLAGLCALPALVGTFYDPLGEKSWVCCSCSFGLH